jgi:hypothetical protein
MKSLYVSCLALLLSASAFGRDCPVRTNQNVESPYARLIPVDRSLNNYSNGYRLGEITKVSDKGNIVISSIEGTMNVGVDAGTVILRNRFDDQNPESNYLTPAEAATMDKKDYTRVSPWTFSIRNRDQQFLCDLEGYRFVLVHYTQHHVSHPLRDTDYLFRNGFKIGERPLRPSYYGVDPARINQRSDGRRSGRIIKVSNKNAILTSWEMQFQEGGSGNRIHLMSLQNENIARYAILAMASGLRVSVYYRQAGRIANTVRFTAATDYDVHTIEIAPQELQRFQPQDFVDVPRDLIENNDHSLDDFIWNNIVRQR